MFEAWNPQNQPQLPSKSRDDLEGFLAWHASAPTCVHTYVCVQLGLLMGSFELLRLCTYT